MGSLKKGILDLVFILQGRLLPLQGRRRHCHFCCRYLGCRCQWYLVRCQWHLVRCQWNLMAERLSRVVPLRLHLGLLVVLLTVILNLVVLLTVMLKLDRRVGSCCLGSRHQDLVHLPVPEVFLPRLVER